jgi:hypothetical protein
MKNTKIVVLGSLLILAVGAAGAQSLGDYAREARKNKAENNSASRHFDNDNLPTGEGLSVVGPPPGGDTKSGTAADSTPPASANDRQKSAELLKEKLEKQKEKINSLSHDLELDQRELRLRAATAYTDPGVSVRNVQWNKDDVRYKSDLEAKQKELDAARQELDSLQDQAHKAGIAESANSDKVTGKDQGSDKSEKSKDQDKDPAKEN